LGHFGDDILEVWWPNQQRQKSRQNHEGG